MKTNTIGRKCLVLLAVSLLLTARALADWYTNDSGHTQSCLERVTLETETYFRATYYQRATGDNTWVEQNSETYSEISGEQTDNYFYLHDGDSFWVDGGPWTDLVYYNEEVSDTETVGGVGPYEYRTVIYKTYAIKTTTRSFSVIAP